MTIFEPQEIYVSQLTEAGQGKPWLTLVHGFSQDQRYFEPQLAGFREDYNLFLADLRGHGRSPASPGPFGVEEYADDLQAALTQAGITQTHYWGTHTGGAIGLLLAERQPQLIRSLVLESPSLPGFSMPVTQSVFNRAVTLAQTRGLSYALRDWFEFADWFEYMFDHPEEASRTEHGKMVLAFRGEPWLTELAARPVVPLAEMLKQIQAPVLVYQGEEEISDFKYVMQKLLADLPQVEGAVIPQAGSFPAWENPSAVTPLVQAFLKKHS